MRLNLPRPFPPMRIIYGGMAITPFWLAKCIMWARTQLHGFETRTTTDIYPADFGWTPDYRKPGERIDWCYHNLGSVTGAGVAEISNQMEYDDEVAAALPSDTFEFTSIRALAVSLFSETFWRLARPCCTCMPAGYPITAAAPQLITVG